MVCAVRRASGSGRSATEPAACAREMTIETSVYGSSRSRPLQSRASTAHDAGSQLPRRKASQKHEASVVNTARSASCSLERVMSRGAIAIPGGSDAREAPRSFEPNAASGGE